MSSSMQRIVSRPFGGRNSAPSDAPTQEPPDPPTQSGRSDVGNYMLSETDRLEQQWINPHVAAYHSSRSRGQTQSGTPALRTMTPEQRAAYVAQREAENAAAQGSDSHPPLSPSRPAPVPPTPRLPTQYRSTLAAPPGHGAAQSRQALDVPETPQVSSDPDAPGPSAQPADAGDTSDIERPMDRLPTPPQSPRAAAPAVQRASAALTAAVSVPDGLQSPIHFVPPRRRSSMPVRSDVEIEVRGMGADRVVTIRLLSPLSNVASGATGTRQ